MIKSLTIKKPESEHRIFGAGTIEIEYNSNVVNFGACLSVNSKFGTINFYGAEAEKTFKKYMNDESKNEVLNIETIEQFAADSCETTIEKMRLKKRDENLVQARQLVMWYALRKLRFSYQKASDIYGQDHATAVHALNQIEKEEKYKKHKHSEMHKRFFEMINEVTR